MWPWESAVFAYLCYSLYCHARYRERPGGSAVFLAAAASVLPDLIDKPLAWQYGVFESGYALGHSLLVAVPVGVAAAALARRWGRGRLGVAFGVGLVAHDVGDALEHAVEDHSVVYGAEHALWPVYRLHDATHGAFSATTLRYLSGYLHDVLTLTFTPYLQLVAVIALCVLPVWIYDGCPGARELGAVLAFPVAVLRR